jgi:hypothetical protein
MARPLGVTVIAILMVIGGIVMLFAGIAAVVAGSLLPFAAQTGNLPDTIPVPMLGGAAVGFGAFMLALGIAALVIAYGLFKGRGWAWTAAVVLSIIGIALAVLQIATSLAFGDPSGIISLIINGVILYYLYRPHVKAYFGKAVSPAPPDAAAA